MVGSELVEECCNFDDVPARLYVPKGAEELLLLGHRGTQSKDHPRFVELGRRYARETGLAVVCIDAPAHGERRPDSGHRDQDLKLVIATIGGRQDVTAPDWRLVCERLSHIGPPTAYVGFSMGAMMGVAVVATLPTIRCAVFWVAGLPAPDPSSSQSPAAFLEYAHAAGRAEILMINTTEDEIMGPHNALRLFNAIGGTRKRLHFHPGDHGAEPDEAVRASIDFIGRTPSLCPKAALRTRPHLRREVRPHGDVDGHLASAGWGMGVRSAESRVDRSNQEPSSGPGRGGQRW